MAWTNKAKNTKSGDRRQTIFVRFTLIVAFLVIWMGGIGARLVYLQVKQHDWLKKQASGQRRDVKKTKLPRGTIYDRNGRTLAISVDVKTLYADPELITDVKSTAKKIAKALNLNETKVASDIAEAKTAERRYLPLAKGLDEVAVQAVNRALDDPGVKKADEPNFTGLYWRKDQKRSYPHETLAAQVIGFSDGEGVGQAGIEQSQNSVLYGAVIKKTQMRDRLGRVYDETISEQESPKDIVLTISTSIQYKVEQALERAVNSSGAKSGMAVVIDQKSGEILALANYPSFDPNNLREINAENAKNGIIQNIYSPGSVFKLVTYGAALEKHLITPDGEIDAGNGTIEIAKHKFTDSHSIGRVTYSKALAHSSNVCAIKTGMRVGRETFYQTVQEMGFGKRTGIELPAETTGIVRSLDRWNGDSLASMSIGYEIGVSALQMTSAFATIANNGLHVQPHIIKEIRDSSDGGVTATELQSKQIVTADTARDLRTMMRQVVLSGTGKRAQLNGYTSAGKTGTAWKFDEKLKKVNSAKYISSFIGFAPAENPAITIGVVMDEPKVGGRDGGQVAGPVFKEIAEQILPELNVPRDGNADTAGAKIEDIPEIAPDDEANEVKSLETDDVEQPKVSESGKGVKKPADEDPKVPKPVADVKKQSKPEAPKKDATEKKSIVIKSAPKSVSADEKKQKGQIKNKSSTGIRKE